MKIMMKNFAFVNGNEHLGKIGKKNDLCIIFLKYVVLREIYRGNSEVTTNYVHILYFTLGLVLLYHITD